MRIKPWFESGFDKTIKTTIQKQWPKNATLRCQDESHRWAKVLLELNPAWDIELSEGMFQLNGDPCQSEGHTWLVVEGYIFDPTASQFSGDFDSLNYEVHNYCDGQDLLQRLTEYGYAVSLPNQKQVPSLKGQ